MRSSKNTYILIYYILLTTNQKSTNLTYACSTLLGFAQTHLQDLCAIHACISIVSVPLAIILAMGIFRRNQIPCVAWLCWTGLRIVFYILGPIILAIASAGVPRIRGSNGIFFFFVMPFLLAGAERVKYCNTYILYIQ